MAGGSDYIALQVSKAQSNVSSNALKQGNAKIEKRVRQAYSGGAIRMESGRLRARIGAGSSLRGKSVLCIGARGGGEVRAFRKLGAFAVGVDLYPAIGTNLVLPGNALDLQFADTCVDRVYINVIDHIPDLPRFAREVMRVLKFGGLLWLDVRCQWREADPWAVRTTGSAEFYDELKTAMANASAMAAGAGAKMVRCTLAQDELAQRLCQHRLHAQQRVATKRGRTVAPGSLSLDYGETWQKTDGRGVPQCAQSVLP